MSKFLKAISIILAATVISAAGLCGCNSIETGGGEPQIVTEEITLVVTQTSVKVEKGGTVELRATHSQAKQIAWVSADSSIATVDGGVVTGVKVGQTQIIISDGEINAICEVQVVEPPAEPEPTPPAPPAEPDAIALSFGTIELEKGKTTKITAMSPTGTKMVWSSADESVATVEGGLVTAIKVGSTRVTVTAGTASAYCTIKVVEPKQEEEPDPVDPGPVNPDPPAPTLNPSITVSESSKQLTLGDSFALTATITDIPDGTLQWYSSNTAAVSIEGSSGNTCTLKAVGAGQSMITAKKDNHTATCLVVVSAPAGIPEKEGYTLVWHDEFDGTALDSTKWNYQTGVMDNYNGAQGPWFWGNGELQYYTNSASNVGVRDGSLYITAKKENMPNDRTYSSARILTRDKFSRAYGYFEAKMKTPTGDGMWPAFWMLPQPKANNTLESVYGGWPVSGEIDIMEAKGRLKNQVDTTLHFAAGTNHRYEGATSVISSDTDEWHTYAVDWQPDYIKWYIDGKMVMARTKQQYTNTLLTGQGYAVDAPFDVPFYVLFNLAVGGQYDGGVAPGDDFTSATMYVDYLRVWSKNA